MAKTALQAKRTVNEANVVKRLVPRAPNISAGIDSDLLGREIEDCLTVVLTSVDVALIGLELGASNERDDLASHRVREHLRKSRTAAMEVRTRLKALLEKTTVG